MATTYHSWNVPHTIYERAEAEARAERKLTGKLTRWTDILRRIVEAHYGCQDEVPESR